MPSSSPPRTEAPPLTRVERARPLLGTLVAIRVDATPAVATPALAAAFAAIEAVHGAMSFHDPDSPLSRLNREAALGPVAVDRPSWRVLRASLALARASQGRFDPAVGARLVQWGQLPAPDGPACDPDADWRDVELLPGRQVRFRRRLWLDFGGIAKGHAVDSGIAILKAQGIRNGEVTAGGDSRVLGDRRGRPWVIGIRHPDDRNRVIARIPLEDAAISTSGDYERFFDEDGVRYHHIIDPKTGKSPHGVRSVTVIAPTSTLAEGLTKSVFIMGPERGLALVETQPDCDAVVVTAEGKVLYSKGLAAP